MAHQRGKVLVIDNYDSFAYNLVQALGELGADPVARRNDEITLEEIASMRPLGIVLSPGPCTPQEAGISLAVVRRFSGAIPILGVCLGHQCIGEAFGGKVVRAPLPMHGKTSMIHHDGKTIFASLPNPILATRYHSLIVELEGLPECLEVSAWSSDGLIMGLRHRQFLVEGVQFHPESILTTHGKEILQNFLLLAQAFWNAPTKPYRLEKPK
ncbi:MAG: aminodeoxychorismate/anthranilate synthase component II [Armatimonadota bacterium]|nr:aminodeoxychorismate/anthranilate synthase component II [Armatimonadota bacterium]